MIHTENRSIIAPRPLCLAKEVGLGLSNAGMTRRALLQRVNSAVLAMALGGMPLASFSDEVRDMSPGRGPNIPKWPEPNQTRQIWLVRQETGETLVARYFDNRRIQMPSYLAVCHLLRDVRTGTVVHIDIELMDLVFAIQSWLVSWGIDIPMLITSGYRSPQTNGMLEGAAKNSLHMQGRAIDVRMKGVPVDYLGRLASIFSAGGVGFYANRNFNHLDTGNVRYWRGR